MSLDWPWPVKLALVIPPAVGHLCHFVYVINVGSGLGVRERPMDRIRRVLFTAFWLSAALLLWKHLHEPWWTWSGPLGGYALLCAFTGTLVWPFLTWRLIHRRRPDGIIGTDRTVDIARSHPPQALIGPGRRAWFLRLPGNQSFQLCLREWQVTIPNLPAELDGLSIVQLTDFHLAPCFQRAFFDSVIDHCLPWRADLVVVTGDLLEHDETVEWIEPILGRLEARLGKFAILGNHDSDHHPQAIVSAMARAGFETLEGRWITRNSGRSVIAIGGTSAPWGPSYNDCDVPPADFHILLSHSPDHFFRARRSRVDLMLAGHNHGGQIRLPVVGPIFIPSRYSRLFDRGFFRAGPTLMYVSEGLAGAHPVRYGCPPEASRFVLKALPLQ